MPNASRRKARPLPSAPPAEQRAPRRPAPPPVVVEEVREPSRIPAVGVVGVVGTIAVLGALLLLRPSGAGGADALGGRPGPTKVILGPPAPGGIGLAGAAGTTDGDPVQTPYGTVQVRITVAGGRITDIVALALPDGDRRTRRISQIAGPMLHDETLSAQSANINTISGATYTSGGYIRSLQSALDKAGR